ncbi:hypothetical protein BJV78DRAFT_1158471 [Lactifluus subvellereus]|nr:hypothetical protein BJV78DRAFT_1158471 [Lactifluus subvellereus]
MPGCWSTTICLPLIGRLGRRAPSLDSRSSSSLSLFLLPTREPIELTSKGPHSHIYTLNDDVLLNVFFLYQLDAQDEYDDEDGQFDFSWEGQRWWYKLAHVCQRWRHLILASPSRLDLHLVCTYGVPVADMLAHSPPLPLTIDYRRRHHGMNAEDEEGVLLALCHHDRVHRIVLDLPPLNLRELIATMDQQFPILERMVIYSWTNGDRSLILPKTFQAPQLHNLMLWHAALPIGGFPLLTTAAGLVTLALVDIPASAYFPPSCLLTRLSLMPQLQELVIGFHSPPPNRDSERQLLGALPMNVTHITLPNLCVFGFQGVSAYLESLLSRISAPLLSRGRLQIMFFNQLTFAVPHLVQFMLASQNLRFDAFRLTFDKDFVDLLAGQPGKGGVPPFRMRIMCRHLDWQVASAVQILGTFSPVLSVVEELTLCHVEHNRSSELHNEVDRAQWRELLRPFSNVKTLRVPKELVGELSRSLRSEDGEMPLELLPNLKEVKCSGGIPTHNKFIPFINERRDAGCLVTLVMADGPPFDYIQKNLPLPPVPILLPAGLDRSPGGGEGRNPSSLGSGDPRNVAAAAGGQTDYDIWNVCLASRIVTSFHPHPLFTTYLAYTPKSHLFDVVVIARDVSCFGSSLGWLETCTEGRWLEGTIVAGCIGLKRHLTRAIDVELTNTHGGPSGSN